MDLERIRRRIRLCLALSFSRWHRSRTKRRIKLFLALFSSHWHRVLRIELLRRSSRKFRRSAILRKYWIEATIENRVTIFRVYRRKRRPGTFLRKRVQISEDFFEMDNAESFIFEVVERKLSET